MNSEALSVKSRNDTFKGALFLMIFFGMFGACGFIFLYMMAIAPMINMWKSTDWVETPCTIISSKVKRHRGDNNNTYSVEIKYSYKFGQAKLTGDRYNFVTGSSSGRSPKQKIVNQFPPKKKTVCYVNPVDPRESVLRREMLYNDWTSLFLLIPVVFFGIGLAGVIYGVRTLIGAKSQPETEPGTIQSLHHTKTDVELTTYQRPLSTGPTTLKSSNAPWKSALVLFGIALFWNGIVSVFLSEVVSGWMKGNPNWFLTLFMTPFVAVGFGLICGIFYFLLAMLNPKAVLTIENSVIEVGDKVQLLWQIDGRVDSIRKVTLKLTGEESATYRQGTRTHTDTNAFIDDILFETEDTAAMSQGRIDVVIPENTMHTWKADNNEVKWKLKINCDIPKWPDVNGEFPITVVPKNSSSAT